MGICQFFGWEAAYHGCSWENCPKCGGIDTARLGVNFDDGTARFECSKCGHGYMEPEGTYINVNEK